MGIHIKKMRMPTGPETVHLIVHSDSRVETSLINGDKTFVYKDDYLADAVEPHGRAIDANLFLIKLRNEMFHKKIDIDKETYEKLRKIVSDMDTVVWSEYEFEKDEFLSSAKEKGEQDDGTA